MRLVMLIENTAASEKLLVEHGLSMYIENNGRSYLFDTGASGRFLTNAKRMRLPLDSVGSVVISHNHFAHTGGIEPLVRQNRNITFFAKREAIESPVRKSGLVTVPLGNLGTIYRKMPGKFVLFSRFQQVDTGFFLLSNEFPCDEDLKRDKNNKIARDGKFLPDYFEHETFAVIFPDIDKRKGCVIVTGCAHCGIVNIIKTVRKTWENVPILAIVGGFHMMGATTKKLNCSLDYIEDTITEIRRLDVGIFYTCHCTGFRAYDEMKVYLGDQLQYLQTGEEIVF